MGLGDGIRRFFDRGGQPEPYEGPLHRNPELEAAALADPNDPEPYLVYGAWLREQGDPRGDLISLQAARYERPDDPALAEAEGALLARLGPRLLGSLAQSDVAVGVFRLGFLDQVRLGASWDEAKDVLEQLEELLTLPDLPFVRELTIGLARADDENNYQDVIAALAAAADRLPRLEALFVGDFDQDECELSWSELGDVSPLWGAFSTLERLTLRAGGMTLGDIACPSLEQLTIETGGFSPDSLRSIIAADWPALERLSLWLGDPIYGGECTPTDVAPLLQAERLGRLRHLGLMNAVFTDELVGMLAASPVLKQLTSLDLSMGCLSGEGVEALLDNRAAFAHLDRLDLSNNCLSADEVTRAQSLKGEIATVRLGEQEPDRIEGGERYVAVGE